MSKLNNKAVRCRFCGGKPITPDAQVNAVVDEEVLRSIIGNCIRHDWGDGDSYNACLYTAQTVINAIRPYLSRPAIPDKEALEQVKMAIGKALIPDGVWNIEEGWKLESAAKAALATLTTKETT